MASPRSRRHAAPAPSSASTTLASTAAERAAVFTTLRPVVAMLEPMVGPHIEIALHDLSQPECSVVAIANGHLSGRGVGSSILSGPRDDIAFAAAWQEAGTRGAAGPTVIPRYPTVTADGRPLLSATVVYRDAAGAPFAALCLNADVSHFQAAHAWLARYLGQAGEVPAPPVADAQPTPALMQTIADEAVARSGRPVGAMRPAERQQAVESMLNRGLFAVRGGVEHAAAALQVSRFTVYNDIKAIRARHA